MDFISSFFFFNYFLNLIIRILECGFWFLLLFSAKVIKKSGEDGVGSGEFRRFFWEMRFIFYNMVLLSFTPFGDFVVIFIFINLKFLYL